MIRRTLLCASLAFASVYAHAEGDVIHRYISRPGKPIQTVVSGLVNMTEIMNKTGDGCEQFIGLVKVEGVQFSSSGVTLESFRFTDHYGNQWSVPTNIGDMSNIQRSEANNFIRTGRSYYVQVQICGSGGYPSLVNMYDAAIQFGHD